MPISYKTDGVEISALRDRAMFNTFAGNQNYIIQDLGNEFVAVYSSSSFAVTIGSGEAVLCGGSLSAVGTSSITLSANSTGYLVIRVDLTQTTENVCSLANVSSIVNGNLNNGSDTMCDLPLYQYTTNGSGVSRMTDMRSIVNSSSEYISGVLSTVATTGNYNDLNHKPTIPTVDSSLSATSTNPVQNRVIYNALAGKTGTPDTAMSSSSTNAVQNKVINTALAGKANTSHTHGTINNNGTISNTYSVADNDKFVIARNSGGGQLALAAGSFQSGTTYQYLSRTGAFSVPSEVSVSTQVPSANLGHGTSHKIVYLTSKPAQFYSGYIYLIKE